MRRKRIRGSRRYARPGTAHRPTPRARSVLAAAPPARLWPSLLAVAAGLVLASASGGYASDAWPFAGLFLLALLLLSARPDLPARPEHARAVRWALGLLLAFCAWSALSAAWAAVPEIAWEGAHKTLLFAIVLAVVAARPWPPGALVAALGLVVVGLVVLAVGVLAGADPSAQFLEGRLAAPVGYANADAALWLLGLWPALALACRPALAWPWRAAAAGACCLLAEMALLAQSRGSVIGFAAAAAVAVLVARDRWRFVLALAAVLADVALAASTLLRVRDATTIPGLVASVGDARAAIAWTCVLAVLGTSAALLAARRIRGSAEDRARRARAAHRALAGLAVAGALAGLVAIGDPVAWAHARWADFRSAGYTQLHPGGSRFTGSLGSGRYDFYRVALDEWRAHPLQGIGYDNFQVPYLEHRRTAEAPLYAHSLVLGVLAGTGLVGAALLVAAFGAIGAGVRRTLRAHPQARGLAAGALAGAAGWLVHAQVDWIWEFPALGILAFALLGLALRAGEPADDPPRPSPARARRRVAAAALTALLAASLTALGVAGRLSTAAFNEAGSHPAASLDALEVASRLEPLSADPLITRGIVARRTGQTTVALASLHAAVGREPENWFAHLELGMVEAGAARRAAATAELRRSGALDPGETLIGALLLQVRRGAKIDANAAETTLLSDIQRRLPVLGGS